MSNNSNQISEAILKAIDIISDKKGGYRADA